jgi:hypothetical protein
LPFDFSLACWSGNELFINGSRLNYTGVSTNFYLLESQRARGAMLSARRFEKVNATWRDDLLVIRINNK